MQTKLNDLYSDGIPGSKDEFMAYYTLHLVAHSQLGGDDGALQRTALMNWLRSMTESERSGPAVAHALKVRAATAMDNNVAFFQLKACAPNLGARIMELHEEQMRFNATTVLTRCGVPMLADAADPTPAPVALCCVRLTRADCLAAGPSSRRCPSRLWRGCWGFSCRGRSSTKRATQRMWWSASSG